MSFSEPLVCSGDLRPLQHHQQLSLVDMQPLEQAVQRDEAGTAQENTVEPSAQGGSPARAWLEPVSPETGIVVPDQAADPNLRLIFECGDILEAENNPVWLFSFALRMSAAVRAFTMRSGYS